MTQTWSYTLNKHVEMQRIIENLLKCKNQGLKQVQEQRARNIITLPKFLDF